MSDGTDESTHHGYAAERVGFGIPALAILMMGARIDSSASLYLPSLTFANQWPRVSFLLVAGAIAPIGAVLVLAGVDMAFIPFLTSLGIALPPLASVLVLSGLLSRPAAGAARVGRRNGPRSVARYWALSRSGNGSRSIPSLAALRCSSSTGPGQRKAASDGRWLMPKRAHRVERVPRTKCLAGSSDARHGGSGE
jgi:hypothetical protein